ncbi:carbonic anhydrase family protein [Lentilactobacillus kisonensis]|nr:carbonic anhydrase family protein [Lentilactobacillus kisonensis]
MLDYTHQEQWQNGFGTQQSPIEIKTLAAVKMTGALQFKTTSRYQLQKEIDDQTTIRLPGNGQAEIFGRPFAFQQVHFHAPSEHVIDGKHDPLEVHLVHQNAIGQLAVVALMVQVGAADPVFQQIITSFHAGTTASTNSQIDQWLPDRPVGFHYLGSLTTPPLTEGVEWLVVTNPKVTISETQLDWFKQQFRFDNRQVQALNGRKVERYS